MKRALLPFLLATTLTFLVGAQQRPVLAVFDLSVSEADPRLVQLARSVTETVVFSLKLMGDYDVVEVTGEPGEEAPARLAETAARGGYDALLFGSLDRAGGGYRIAVSLFDHAVGAVTLAEETAFDSLLASFEAADLLTLLLVDRISGVRVTYGSVTFRTTRSDPVRLEIDGIDLGENTRSLSRVVVGTHRVAIFQDRGNGEQLISDLPVEVREGEQTAVEIPIPWLLPDEAVTFARIDRAIRSRPDGADGETTTELFAEALALASRPFFATFRPSIRQRYEEWQRILVQPSGSRDIAGTRSLTSTGRSRLGTQVARSIGSGGGRVAGTTLPERAHALETGTRPDSAMIVVDGSADDWVGVSTMWTDPEADAVSWPASTGDGHDLVRVGVATDGNRLFLALETRDHVYADRKQYRGDLGGGNLIALGWNTEASRGYVSFVPGSNWSNATGGGPDDQPIRAASGEIVEISFPIDRIDEWTEMENGVVNLRWFIQENAPPWRQFDYYSQRIVLPTIETVLARQ